MKSKNLRFKLNKSRLQYWMYCLVATHFGKNAKITRDPLCRRYEANKHSFSISVNQKLPIDTFNWIEADLLSKGFQKADNLKSFKCFEKTNEHGDRWGFCISMTPKEVIVNPYFYAP